jgi:hypothetical protein
MSRRSNNDHRRHLHDQGPRHWVGCTDAQRRGLTPDNSVGVPDQIGLGPMSREALKLPVACRCHREPLA